MGSRGSGNGYGSKTLTTKSVEREWVKHQKGEIEVQRRYARQADNERDRRLYESNVQGMERVLQERQERFERSRELLKGKGKPESIDEALKKVNLDENGRQRYRNNCQRCVIAYELRRRGYNVEAVEWDGWKEGSNSWQWTRALEGATYFENIGARTRKQTLPKIAQKMEEWGEGSRAFVAVAWDNSTSSHVFNAEYHNGNVVFVDAQTGKYVKWSEYNALAKPSSIEIVRVDHLKPTAEIANMVRRGRK